jgi:hypothetical protein
MGVREGCARNLAHGRARRVQLRDEATRALKSSRVGHIAAEFERLANVLLRRGCGNPALITYPRRRPRSAIARSYSARFDTHGSNAS